MHACICSASHYCLGLSSLERADSVLRNNPLSIDALTRYSLHEAKSAKHQKAINSKLLLEGYIAVSRVDAEKRRRNITSRSVDGCTYYEDSAPIEQNQGVHTKTFFSKFPEVSSRRGYETCVILMYGLCLDKCLGSLKSLAAHSSKVVKGASVEASKPSLESDIQFDSSD